LATVIRYDLKTLITSAFDWQFDKQFTIVINAVLLLATLVPTCMFLLIVQTVSFLATVISYKNKTLITSAFEWLLYQQFTTVMLIEM